MVNVKDKTCERDGCYKIPFYNVAGSKAGRFCATHKEPEMINVKDKTCERDGCYKIPNYNFAGSKAGRFCSDHKQDGMIDVKNRNCDEDGCDTHPTYGHPGFAPTRCAQHKVDGMLVKSNARCFAKVVAAVGSSAAKTCGAPATHGVRHPERCETCAIEGDINLVEKVCSACGLVMRSINPVSGKCDFCSAGVAKTVRLAKQREVVQFLSVNTSFVPTSVDRIPAELKASTASGPTLPTTARTASSSSRWTSTSTSTTPATRRGCSTLRRRMASRSASGSATIPTRSLACPGTQRAGRITPASPCSPTG